MDQTTSTTDELTGKIIGAAMKVHGKLGFSFVESVYENSLAHELRKAGFKAEQQVPIKVYYDGIVVRDFKADLVVNDDVVLELKAVERANTIHEGQLVNFGARSLEFKRKYRRPKDDSSRVVLSGLLGLMAVVLGKLLGHF